MGLSMPWSGGRRARLAYRNVLAPAAAAVLCAAHGVRLPRRRSKRRPEIWVRPQCAIRRSSTNERLKRQRK